MLSESTRIYKIIYSSASQLRHIKCVDLIVDSSWCSSESKYYEFYYKYKVFALEIFHRHKCWNIIQIWKKNIKTKRTGFLHFKSCMNSVSFPFTQGKIEILFLRCRSHWPILSFTFLFVVYDVKEFLRFYDGNFAFLRGSFWMDWVETLPRGSHVDILVILGRHCPFAQLYQLSYKS